MRDILASIDDQSLGWSQVLSLRAVMPNYEANEKPKLMKRKTELVCKKIFFFQKSFLHKIWSKSSQNASFWISTMGKIK